MLVFPLQTNPTQQISYTLKSLPLSLDAFIPRAFGETLLPDSADRATTMVFPHVPESWFWPSQSVTPLHIESVIMWCDTSESMGCQAAANSTVDPENNWVVQFQGLIKSHFSFCITIAFSLMHSASRQVFFKRNFLLLVVATWYLLIEFQELFSYKLVH